MDTTLSPQPETGREDSCFEQRLVRRQAQDVVHDAFDFLPNRGVLPIGTDLLLGCPPQVVHRIELRRPFRQPNQFDIQLGRKLLGPCGRMAGILVQEEGHSPTPVVPANHPQEFLKVNGALISLIQEQPMTGGEVDRAEENPLGIEPGDRDGSLFAAKRPPCLKRRKQKNIGFVLGEDDLPRIQPFDSEEFDAPPDPAFFSLGQDPGSKRSAVVSKRSPDAELPFEGLLRRDVPRSDGTCSGPGEMPSNSQIDIPIPEGLVSRPPGEALRDPRSKSKAVRALVDSKAPTRRRLRDTKPSSDKWNPDGCRVHEPAESRAPLRRLRAERTFVGTPGRQAPL